MYYNNTITTILLLPFQGFKLKALMYLQVLIATIILYPCGYINFPNYFQSFTIINYSYVYLHIYVLIKNKKNIVKSNDSRCKVN